jgi:threonine dehydratase
MRAFGADLIEHGRDFDEAKQAAITIAAERGSNMRLHSTGIWSLG